jgi:hypothetical protein
MSRWQALAKAHIREQEDIARKMREPIPKDPVLDGCLFWPEAKVSRDTAGERE